MLFVGLFTLNVLLLFTISINNFLAAQVRLGAISGFFLFLFLPHLSFGHIYPFCLKTGHLHPPLAISNPENNFLLLKETK